MLTRFIVGALLLSHGTRKDVRASILFDDARLVSFEGWSMRNVRPDEQSLSGILIAGLRRVEDKGFSRVLPGVTARESSIIEITEKHDKKYYYKGPGCTYGLSGDFLVVLAISQRDGMCEDGLRKDGFDAIRVGSRPVTPDQAAVLINNLVDRTAQPSRQ
ncbi:MAG: hypothetical protein QFX35_05185 [Candidatus Verstraetearchaeota archaeon]|nr:hypothetical protein [Candidatus Verstraetearchaeota archaeon]